MKCTWIQKKIEKIYSGNLVRKYESAMSHFFAGFKKKAFEASSLKKEDRVLVFCCGTGLDFPPILKRIGREGKIIGFDFSSEILILAEEKIRKNRWDNIELVQADVTTFRDRVKPKADAGICTLGLSIIPDFTTAYENLLSNVKIQGEIIIGDMQLAYGWKAGEAWNEEGHAAAVIL